MKFYLAPLEGITGFIYRKSYSKIFNDIDKYFAPFVVPNESTSLNTKDFFDILPENNEGVNLVPQILTNNAEGFIFTAKKMKKLGYNEINLNLGCPSSTVVHKNRGAGFLSVPEQLDIFLDKVYDELISYYNNKLKVSIKTRLGKNDPEEFYKLLNIYNKYPIYELIIHPRTQKDFYGNNPKIDMFKYAMEHSVNTICYNGDIFTKKNFYNIEKKIKKESINKDITNTTKINCNKFMLGRGIIGNPGLIYSIKNDNLVPKYMIKEFHDLLLNEHLKVYTNEKGILFKMKEIWSYMIGIFSNRSKYLSEIRKSKDIKEYVEIVNKLFNEEEILDDNQIYYNKHNNIIDF